MHKLQLSRQLADRKVCLPGWNVNDEKRQNDGVVIPVVLPQIELRRQRTVHDRGNRDNQFALDRAYFSVVCSGQSHGFENSWF